MNIFGIDSSTNIGLDLSTSSYKKQNDFIERNSQDTVNISDEARVMFLQAQEAKSVTDDNTGQEDTENSTAQEFKDVLNSHKPGSGSSQSSSGDAIEDVKNQIKQVSSELASASSKATQSNGIVSSSRVEQLESQLSGLEALLAELESAASEESAA